MKKRPLCKKDLNNVRGNLGEIPINKLNFKFLNYKNIVIIYLIIKNTKLQNAYIKIGTEVFNCNNLVKLYVNNNINI